MRKQHRSTTFSKMTISFVLFGLLPLLLLSFLFFYRYGSVTRENTLKSCSTMTAYISRSVGDVMENVDSALGGLYDYRSADGQSLAEIYDDADMPDGRKAQEVDAMLHEIMASSGYISSLRMVDAQGNVFSLYYNQDKTLHETGYERTTMEVFGEKEDPTQLKLLGTVPEEEICVNSEDYVFGMVRNCMDTSSVETASSVPLATLFADISTDEIGKIIRSTGAAEGKFYVYGSLPQRYIYSDSPGDYRNGADPLKFCAHLLDGGSGYEKVGNQWVFYETIPGMDACTVLVLDETEMMGGFFQVRVMMVLILCFACAFLLLLYLAFSIRMSEPTQRLKAAMEQVESGNLDVRVNLNTRDEMEYVADGFNRMVEKLEEYIKQVYVAQISRKDAELNALKMQIQPHYLYNTLDVIRMTALEQNDRKTARLLESLAHQLRYVIGNQSDRVYLREELDAIREYFVLMQERYEGRISLMIDINDEDQMLVIPKLILQPVVENAIRHGLREKTGNGAVGIHVERLDDALEIVVMDDGVGMSEEQVEQIRDALENQEIGVVDKEGRISVGMKNVYDRIRLNCGPEYGFTVQSAPGLGTSVTFRLPVWKEL